MSENETCRRRCPLDPAGVERAVRKATDQVVDGTGDEVGLVRGGGGGVAADQRRLRVEPGRVEAAAPDQRWSGAIACTAAARIGADER